MIGFGTDGIRGTRTQLNEDVAYRAGLALADMLGGGSYVIGRDTRLGGEQLADAVICGICAGGGDCVDLGVVTTPCISGLTVLLQKNCGVMVTASHNPPEYNGIKFFDCNGLKLSRFAEKKIESLMVSAQPKNRKLKRRKIEGAADIYIDEIIKDIHSLGGMRVMLDAAHGSACNIARQAFSAAGARVFVRNNLPDGSRINVKCGALHPSAIKREEAGFAFDGDADRVAVAFDGKIMDGDSVLFTLSENCDLKDGVVIGTVMSNIALETALNEKNRRLIRTDVGDKHISALMYKYGYTLGGEPSGHYIISPFRTGDGIYAALRLADIYRRGGIKFLDPLPQKSLSVYAERDVSGDESIVKLIDYYSLKGVRLVVRMSGTEPKVRIMAESKDWALVDRALKDFAAVIADIKN